PRRPGHDGARGRVGAHGGTAHRAGQMRRAARRPGRSPRVQLPTEGARAHRVACHDVLARPMASPGARAARRPRVCQARAMLRLVFALAIGTWLGAVVSLTYIVTPTAHGAFDPRDARRLLRPLFPRHYTLGIACGFLALGTVLLGKDSLPYEEALRLAI